jgi:hypothetical protein
VANTLVKYGTNHTATKTLPAEADVVGGNYQVYVTLIHEWGKQIVAKTLATRTSALNYSYTFNTLKLRSNGIYKIKWEYEIADTVYVDYSTIDVYTPYATSATFFANYAYLNNAGNTAKFDGFEQKVRNIIHAYCGQTFTYYEDLSLSLDGTGARTLTLPVKLQNFTEVIATINDSLGSTTSDETTSMEKTPDSDWFIRWKGNKGTFKTYASYEITGDWGWVYVPSNVTQAAELLIAEQFNDDNAYRNHGVTDLYMDTHRMRIDEKITFNSTGVIDADVLLMDYIKHEFSWV